ncbi:hypothetical protein Glove_966g6 [Diversispora epigaea]|uniref:Uncharacterized protein n=1 Tax=Diversispora epigaea TaxID=1348612 RepID=A0A397G444_9GLOM|nr:hypothetical protein Glove_966g6 [Diversispora epigaea]
MSLSSEAKKRLREEFQQQCLKQELVEYNKVKIILKGLTDLDYKPGHRKHTYYKYWLPSNGYANSADRDEISLLETYKPEELYSQYIIRTAGKGYTVIDHPSEVYRMPNTHECIDRNQPLHSEKITRDDLMSRILVACADALNLIPDCIPLLNSFTLASSSNAEKCIGEPYSRFIDVGLPKIHFNLRLLESAKEGRIKRPYLFYKKWISKARGLSEERPAEEEYQPIDDENALVKEANLVIANYGWLKIGRTEKGFINFETQSVKKCPICDVKHEKDQLYRFIRKNGHFILKCYRQKQYKPEHKGLSFDKVSDKVKLIVKPKLGLNERIAKVVLNPRPFLKLSGEVINVKEMENAPEVYPNFLSNEPSLRRNIETLSRSGTQLPAIIWISYRKTLSNKSQGKINDLKSSGLKIYEVNAIQLQMNSGSNVRESENAMRDVLRLAQHVLAMDAFTNESKTIEYLPDPNTGAEAMRIGFEYLKQNKHVTFVVTSSNMARALVEKASKLSFKARAYYGDMDGKQQKNDFLDINTAWGELDCVAYTNYICSQN